MNTIEVFAVRSLLGAAVGGGLGWWYYGKVACHSGFCIWTSSRLTSTLTFGLLGLLAATAH